MFGNRFMEIFECIWVVIDVLFVIFLVDVDSKDEEDLVKVLVVEDLLVLLEFDWWIDWKN